MLKLGDFPSQSVARIPSTLSLPLPLSTPVESPTPTIKWRKIRSAWRDVNEVLVQTVKMAKTLASPPAPSHDVRASSPMGVRDGGDVMAT
ncbi:hypothetical protein E2C01_088124 [Portunus trituberculatus]|uniref:Uncharacterized protein n=1 Tax=Portunus trituberculatus TaxID=210409 RepID=A0A5B7JDN2_PORTR|nr:hypothetical protein [Portunus trituberculatus]